MKNAAKHFPEACRRVAAWLGTVLLLAAASARADVQWLDRIAVIVDNDVIMESDIQARAAEVRQQMSARKARMPPGDILRKQITERLIVESLQLQLGKRMGIRIDDETLNAALTNIAKQNGVGLREFLDQLAAEGYDYAEFREQVRRDILINRVRQRRVGDRVRITESDVSDFMKSADARDLFGDSFRLALILVAVPDSAGIDEVKAASDKANALLAEALAGADFSDLAVRSSDAANALDGGDLGWRNNAQLPQMFAGMVGKMKPGDIAGPVRTASGFHLVKLVDRKSNTERVVQQAQVRHILIKPSAIRSNREAREFAAQLRTRVERGEDFAELAKRYSDDTGSALAGGDLGWVTPGQMVEEFDAATAATATGEYSPAFETQYGWHFLQVTARRDQDASDEYRKLQARNAVWKRKFDAEVETWEREIRNEASVDIKPVPEAP